MTSNCGGEALLRQSPKQIDFTAELFALSIRRRIARNDRHEYTGRVLTTKFAYHSAKDTIEFIRPPDGYVHDERGRRRYVRRRRLRNFRNRFLPRYRYNVGYTYVSQWSTASIWLEKPFRHPRRRSRVYYDE